MLEQKIYEERIKEKISIGFTKESKSFTGFFIKNYRFTYLIIFAILLAGFFAAATLPREANPEIQVPIAVVTTIYQGASPTDIEDLVTNKIEDKIKNLDDLKKYTSTSGTSVSSVVVEFDAEADLQESYQKLRDSVDEAGPSLPDAAEDSVVTEVRLDDFPIVTYSLVGNFLDAELKEYADILKTEFENIRNVSEVNILGGLEREFQIIVDQKQLANFGLSLSQIVGVISQSNINVPAGNIEIDGFEYSIRIKGKFDTARDISNIVITTKNGTSVYIRDVAEVKDTFKKKESESRIGFSEGLPSNTVSLQIYKKSGGNILQIVEESNKITNRLKAEGIIPSDMIVQKTNDNSVFIREDLGRLSKSGVQTMVLIVLILFAVLGFRAALITGLSVPIAFLMAFVVLQSQGMTLNGMVLFSLVLSLGLMVDNSIVIMEGINEYMKKYKKTGLEAAILSIWNYKWPIIAGTMTTVAAFAPMLLVSGILGEYLSIIPITLSATLISSLFVALIILPTLAARNVKEHGRMKYEAEHHKQHWLTHYMELTKVWYIKKLRAILPYKKKRRKVILYSWITFLVAVSLPFLGLIEIQMFPQVDVDYFVVNIKLPVGSVLEDTRTVVAEAEVIIAQIPELDNYVTNIGTSASVGLTDNGSGVLASHLASITVNLTPKNNRERKSFEIAASIRDDLEAIKGGDITLEELNSGPPTGAPIEVRIIGSDIGELSQVSTQIISELENINGVINVKDNLEDATGEFTFSIDKARANYYGLSIASVAGTFRSAVYGATASEVNIDGDDVDVTVRYAEEGFSSVDDLENIILTTPRGELISMKQIATLSLEPSLLNIRHNNGDNTVSVTANIEPGINLQEVLAEFDNRQEYITVPDNVSVAIGGEVEDIEKSFQEAFLSMIVAIILIAFILVLQFNSFRQPFIILFTLPLAIIGAIVGLLVLRLPFSFPVFIGIVSLSGIVVNDAIVLIDKINKNIKNGMDFVDGIIEAGIARMQPIFLTSLTTIAGLLPLTFADELWKGLGWVVIFGLLFSTVLTLLMVPIAYAGMCKDDKCFSE